ncbi:FkbM family methyltransferase [Natronolimnohabitans innermongolicus]|uniref:FkbM family methyltransferase n=1 Tax=Natronolimnohabitans innermongolicus JCM 12255 TaxID=1227499 RepID=L9X1M2_9EURY|nr:FkbM family methyltransferase [Natronolimnohabitans innermongolicus]ELY55620.1 FkbM family methyltransferase [Natronolimnohabitans innermongolicus JCM 12255]
MAPLGAVGTRLFRAARSVGYRSYYRLARANYDRELLARRNRTPAGVIRCYEPLPRHGDDAMLAALEADCGPDDVIYDIGANVGIYALALATDAPERRIVAFEPATATVERLRANVRLNGLEGRITIRACGVGDESDRRPFYVSTYHECSAFDRESATRWEADVAAVRSVPIRRLDALVGSDGSAAEPLPPPDALKLDVEGGAPAALRGARDTLERHRPTVFLEVHDEGLQGDVPGETRTILEDADYEIGEFDGYWRCSPE